MLTADSPERLRIAQLFDGQMNPNEGVCDYVTKIGDYMREQGHVVWDVVGGMDNPPGNTLIFGQTNQFRGNGNNQEASWFVSGQRVGEILDQADPDLFHTQMPHIPTSSGRLLLRRCVPSVGSFHVYPGDAVTWATVRAYGQYARRLGCFDAVISNSTATQKLVHKVMGVESTVIPCPVDVEELRKGQRLPEYDDGKKNVVFLGRLVERKGASELINAFAELGHAYRQDMRLIIAGKGPLEARLKAQVEAQHIEDQVIFEGFVDDNRKRDLFASADAAVFPATGGESFGIVLAEAMAAGARVVLGGNNPGYSSVLEDVPETIIDPKDTHLFSEMLYAVTKCEGFIRDLHARQQQLVDRFDIKVVGAQIEEVYASIR